MSETLPQSQHQNALTKIELMKHLITVNGGKEYLPVAPRIVAFRELFPGYGMEDEIVSMQVNEPIVDENNAIVPHRPIGFAIVRTIITSPDGRTVATGMKRENEVEFPDFLEKAATGSQGRALAALGIGTLFAREYIDSDSATNPVDAPTQALASATEPQAAKTGGKRANKPPAQQAADTAQPAPAAPVSASPVVGPVGMIRRISEITASWPEDLATEWGNHITGKFKVDAQTELSKLDQSQLTEINNEIVYAEQMRALGGHAGPAFVFGSIGRKTPEEAVASQKPKSAIQPAQPPAEPVVVDNTLKASQRIGEALDNYNRVEQLFNHMKTEAPEQYEVFTVSIDTNFKAKSVSDLDDNQVVKVLAVLEDRINKGIIPQMPQPATDAGAEDDQDDPFADS